MAGLVQKAAAGLPGSPGCPASDRSPGLRCLGFVPVLSGAARLKDIPDPSGVLSGYNSDPWVVEFPDGRRIRQPKLPRPIQGPYFVICPSCADVIDPIRDGAQPTVGFVSCEICDVDILVPSWKHLRHHWEVILYVFPSLEAEIPTVQRPAFLCLSCQYKLWSWRQDGDSLPYVTERKAVADLWGLPWPGYISFRFDHPPAPFPVVYDPGMAREA